MAVVYVQGEINSDGKDSVSFVLEFALPPLSLPLRSVVQFSKHNRLSTFDVRIIFTPVFTVAEQETVRQFLLHTFHNCRENDEEGVVFALLSA